ncbi:MAG: hypothetical protein OYI31_06110 [Chloroflexota bacterium]|nr:hypothetical protein [Chloroflexota bacterium]MDE2942161.1 hypothetical protein [Chloroflexota bacterium]MDE3268007.1 hypothetical protein [Chloroflexota bacterium]
MTFLKRLAALYLILLGIAVVSHFLATQLYDPTLEGSAMDIWLILDPMMVAGAFICLLVGFIRKLEFGGFSYGLGVSRDYLEANLTFYLSAVLLILVTWNWFGVAFVEPPNDVGLVWLFIDSVLPLLLISTGIRLMRSEE